jgi:succinate dehydrogenase / fumarate reductase iron-sulfur subunit
MRVNGWPMLACGTLVESLEQPVVLEPLHRFPLVRDLAVDRSVMEAQRQRLAVYVELDALMLPEATETAWVPRDLAAAQTLDRCIGCGACLEACPNVGSHSPFMGAAVMHEIMLLHLRPGARRQQDARLLSLAGEGGISDCGNARKCQAVCPAGLALTSSLGTLQRHTTLHVVREWLGL